MSISHDIIMTIIVTIFGSSGFWLLIQKIVESRSASRKMLLGLGFARLSDECRKYLDSGKITINEFNSLTHYLYEPYKALGGNSVGEALYQEVKALLDKKSD